MLNKCRFKMVMVFGVILFLTLLALSGVAMGQSGGEADAAAYGEGGILDAFEQTYATISEQVKKKNLPLSIGEKADQLKFELDKYLITSEARLKVLKLEVRHEQGDKQIKAIEDIAALSAERERTKMSYLERLKDLAKGAGIEQTKPISPAVAASTKKNTEKTTKDAAGKTWKTKNLDVEIEVAPEDISKGDRE